MSGLLMWRGGYDEDKVLWVKPSDGQWQHYKNLTTAQGRRPDHTFPLSHHKHSQGFTTAQELLKRGYKYIPLEESYSINVLSEAKVSE